MHFFSFLSLSELGVWSLGATCPPYSALGTYWSLSGVRAVEVCGEHKPSVVSAHSSSSGDVDQWLLGASTVFVLCPPPVPAGSSWCIRN